MTAASPRRLVLIAAIVISISEPVLAKEKIVAYVPNWVDDMKAFSETIDYTKITHINIAFENPIDDRGDLTFNPNDQILITKAHANNVKILVSIGGAESHDKLRALFCDLLSDAKRANFIAKLATYVADHRFDGLDVDLEGNAINKDYGAFICDLSAAMKAKGQLLTAALSQGFGGRNVPGSVFEHFDFVNVMAYDATEPKTPDDPDGQHSSMEFAKSNVEY